MNRVVVYLGQSGHYDPSKNTRVNTIRLHVGLRKTKIVIYTAV